MTPDPMRETICLLNDDFTPHLKGGAGVMVTALAHELVARGYNVVVVTSVQDPREAGSFHEQGMTIERLYSDYPPRWRAWRSVYNPAVVGQVERILKRERPRVVHAHNTHYHLSYWCLRLAKRSGARVILTAHDAMLVHYGKLERNARGNYRVSAWDQLRTYRWRYNPLRNLIIRWLLRNVDVLLTVSHALEEALRQNGISGVRGLHNGIDVGQWEVSEAAQESFVAAHHLKGKKCILFGGRISAAKGGFAVLSALELVVKKEPDAMLLVLGTVDHAMCALEDEARRRGLAAHLRVMGWLSGEALKAAYKSAVVVVVPSLYLDPLPTVVLEAMAAGKPVVGTCFGGTPEMVVDGETGYVIDPHDSETFARVLLDLLSNPVLSARLGEAGKKRAAQFSLQRYVDEIVKTYGLAA